MHHTGLVENFSLTGQFLVAMPALDDPNFERSVIYVCEHTPKGAMGLIINKPSDIEVRELFKKVDLDIQGPVDESMPVLLGGPVAAERGFVLHTQSSLTGESSPSFGSSLNVGNGLAMTTSRDILEAVASGNSPSQWLITLGYAGWSEGQLEQEIADNAWLTVPGDTRVIFDCPLDQRFDQAMALLGIDPRLLSSEAGHA